jgi:hypothetical protein
MDTDRRIIHEYNGTLFDSREEIWMAMWLEELQKAGYVEFWERVTKSMVLFPASDFPYRKETQLKTKLKVEHKSFTLLHGLTYTPDFNVRWHKKAYKKFFSVIGENIDPKSWFFCTERWFEGFIEVKPNFDQNGKTAKFSIIQKILWNTQKMFVDLCQPEKLFEGTFMPVAAMPDFKYRKAPTGKNKGKKGPGDWKTDYEPKTLKQFLNAH